MPPPLPRSVQGAPATPPPRLDPALAGVPPVLRPAREQRLAPPPPVPPRRHAGYAAAWGIAGLAAAGYAAFLLLPDLRGAVGYDDLPRDQAAALDRTMADVAILKRQVGSLEVDVASVKAQAAHTDAREKQLAERVMGVEGRLEGFSTQIMQVMADTSKKGGAAAPGAVAQSPPPVAPTRVVNAPAPKPQANRLETGTLPAPPPEAVAPRAAPTAPSKASAPVSGWGPATGAPTAAPAAGTVDTQPAGVLLASGPSVDALRLSWSLLNERHRGTLGRMEPRVVATEPGRYQLVAGPIPNETEAQRICTTLRGRGVACQPTDFRGDGL
jgi:hypothetical protein